MRDIVTYDGPPGVRSGAADAPAVAERAEMRRIDDDFRVVIDDYSDAKSVDYCQSMFRWKRFLILLGFIRLTKSVNYPAPQTSG
ncbi:hypothetical protein [Burkholderia orbicola]|uniref:hypothetical protein n=1 Tax=Burkholderia orbicola TaxID=2978683 RepID=UPI00264E21F6|nr:hypothetical protein [Burkholderia orbicola]MCA7925087.1 hypothetical protein [Burkholderia cenocepacia]MDN7775204.1 hypothetical protein [Burkholderia orbicola]